MLRYALASLAVCLALVGAVACGDDSGSQTAAPAQTAAPSQTAAPNQAVCSSVADVQQAAETLRALDPANTTVTQVQAAFTDLQSATSGLASAASAASSADQEALSSAVDGLRSAAQSAAESVAAGESPQKALAAVGAAAVPVEQAADALGPDCPGTGGTTTG